MGSSKHSAQSGARSKREINKEGTAKGEEQTPT